MFGVIIGGVILVILAASVSAWLAITLAVLVVLTAIALAIIQSALAGIYSAALYRYATVGEAPAGFESTGMQGAFAAK
jgi:phage-related minor tail protein